MTGVNQLTYTADFGEGFAASISAVDPTPLTTRVTYIMSVPALRHWQASVLATLAPMTLAERGLLIYRARSASIRLGAFFRRRSQRITIMLRTPARRSRPVIRATSGVGLLSWPLSIKNLPTDPGDTINMQAVYTDGATRYNFQSLAPQDLAMFGGTSVPGAYQSIGLAAAADGVFGPGAGISTVQTWGFRGGYTHN